MNIDLSPLERALTTLNEALAACAREPVNLLYRDGAIQRFKYCYELAWKLLKRVIEETAATPALVDAMSFQELIREGAERGFIRAPREWMEFRKRRNQTSHAYDGKVAAEVFGVLRAFAVEARHLLKSLSIRAAQE